jgi:tetraacyldisaccharide 4'-kinase
MLTPIKSSGSIKERLMLFGQTLIENQSPFLLFLAPVSWLYGLIVKIRNCLYDWHWLKSYRVDCTVVSVGNIIAGGTGKTPFISLLAKRFSHRKVAILTRGYGEVPDEALLLKKHLPLVRIYIGKDRVASAEQAVRDGAELILMDDGFQHRRLARDFDIILEGDSKGHYLPWGFLRDNPDRLKNVDALFSPKLKVSRIDGAPSIRGWKVGLFCGIAKPRKFRETICELGAEVIDEWILADHAVADPTAFAMQCKERGASALICTEKDHVKLPVSTHYALPIHYIEVETEMPDGFEQLIEKIERNIDTRFAYERRDCDSSS